VLALVLTALAPGVARAAEVGPPLVSVSPAGDWVDAWYVDVTLSVDHDEPVAGYAVLADQDALSDPGPDVNQIDPLWSPWLGEGESWLHVRAVLEDGTVSPVAHTRVGIDTQAPWIGELRSPTHPWGEVSSSTDITVEWDVPEDVSGIAGYDVRVTDDPAPPADDSDPAEGTTVTEPTVDLTLPGDGEWYVHVRPRDGAGHWGPFASYDAVVDVAPPAAPVVSGSHVDGVATSQRHVGMTFTENDGDHVAGWAALIDQQPTTEPAAEAARPEPRISTELTPGTWWLHVRGVEASGRAGETTHVELVVRDDPYVLDVPAGKHVWASTTVAAVCAGADAVLVAVDAEGATTPVGALVADGAGGCTATWDPAATTEQGRTWPDGAYDLTVLDAAGDEVAERVAVTVAVESTNVDRLRSDYAAGTLTAEDLAAELLRSAVDPGSVGEAYAAGAATRAPTLPEVAEALTARGELSDALAEMLTPVDESAGAAPAARAASVGACDWRIRFAGVLFDCIAGNDTAVVYWESDDLGDVANGTLPGAVQTTLDSLDRARSVYSGAGFVVPDEAVTVYLTPLVEHNGGLSLPGIHRLFSADTPPSIIMSSVRLEPYLPFHEYFHQVEYQYMPFNRLALPLNNPYWWLEGSAEWGAHLVQDQSPGVVATEDYARSLDEFLSRSREAFDAGGPNTAGGPEYGSFILAEFLEEQYDGPDAVRETWELITRPPFGSSPARAIEEVARGDGDTYAAMISRFREWTYTLDRADLRGTGFSDPDADDGGLWRAALEGRRQSDGTVLPTSWRPPHESVSLDAEHRTASGEVRLAPSGAEYLEITGPADAAGTLRIEVEGPDGLTATTVLDAVESFPTLCPGFLTRAAPDAVALARGRSVESAEGYLGGGDCANAVVVITSTRPLPSPSVAGLPRGGDTYTWTATFEPLGALLSNGTVDVGVHSLGTLGYEWVGIEPTGSEDLHLDVEDDSWGVSDGAVAGGVHGRAYREPGTEGDLRLRSFTYDETSSTSVTETGGLVVTHRVRPVPGTDAVYAIDVTVARESGQSSLDRVRYRRTLAWDGAWNWRYRSTWFKAAGGDDSRVTTLTDGKSTPDPTLLPNGSPVWYTPSDEVSYDAGRTIDLDLGVVPAGSSRSFTLYYGLQQDAAAAAAAALVLGSDVYSVTEQWNAEGALVAVFGYRAD